MTRQFWKAMLASPAILGVVMASASFASEAPSVESLEASSDESLELAQVTSVNDLTDVLPSDWAYTALQNLVETYGCIEGYPNRTFRGNQPMTRYEFAAGLNACLDVIAQLIGTSGVGEGDLATIQRLQQEFQAELATLRGRVDALEAETAELRAQQFSTTTKLSGEVHSHLIVPFEELDDVSDLNADGDFADAGEDVGDVDNNTAFATRVRMNFDTSFTGEDRLRVRLQAGNFQNSPLAAGGGLAFAGGEDLDVTVNDFYYAFPIGDRLDAIVSVNSILTDDFVVSTIVPFDGPATADPSGPVLYDFGVDGDSGAGLSFALTDNIVFDAGYSVNDGDASDPGDGGGLFGSDSWSAIGQLSYLSDGLLDLGLLYIRGQDGGSIAFTDTFSAGTGVVTNTYGGLVSLDFGPMILSGYYAYHDGEDLPTGADDTESWMAGIAFPDLFIEGSQLGAYYADLPSYVEDRDPYMIEGYYSVPINEYIEIIPAVVYGDLDFDGVDNDENWYGTLRAKFTF